MTWTIGEFHTIPSVQPLAVAASLSLAVGDAATELAESVRHLRVVRPFESDDPATEER